MSEDIKPIPDNTNPPVPEIKTEIPATPVTEIKPDATYVAKSEELSTVVNPVPGTDQVITPLPTDETQNTQITSEELEKLPQVLKELKSVKPEQLIATNNIPVLLAAFETYLTISKRVNSGNTLKAYTKNVKQFLIWCNDYKFDVTTVITTLLLRDIVIKYNRVLEKAYPQKNTIAIKLQSIKKFFEHRDFDTLTLNLAQAFNPDWITTADPEAYKRQVRINRDVFDAMRHHVHDSQDQNDMWIFYFLSWGCRRSEICSVKTSDIDFLNKQVMIYQSKTGHVKTLPLPAWCKHKDQIPNNPYLVYARAKNKNKGQVPVTPEFIYDRIKKWQKACMLTDIRITPHSFRRYMIGMLKNKNMNDANIMEISGHSSPNMISKYGYDVKPEHNPIITDGEIEY